MQIVNAATQQTGGEIRRAIIALTIHSLFFFILFCASTAVHASAANYEKTPHQVNAEILIQEFGIAGIANQLYREGLKAFQNGNAELALNSWRSAAEQGHIEAQYNLGLVYSQGYGVEKDPSEAAVWWGKAAEHGDAAAQFNLGVMYADGIGVQQNIKVAARWWHKSADQGFKEAIQALKFLQLHNLLAPDM